MKNTKIVKLAVILTLAALFASCSMFNEPFHPEKHNASGDELAVVNVTIGGNARTILPDFDWNFSKYVLSAESEDDTVAAPEPVEILNGDWLHIGVPYGDWIITATAYVTIDGVDYAVAKGSAPISVWYTDDVYHHYVTISVNAPETGGTGTFAWTALCPSGGSVQAKLKFLSGSGQDDIIITEDGEESIPSGVYFLTVTATREGKTVIRNEIVHIYQQLTSRADYVFTKLDFGDDYLQIGGTIKVLVNGEPPDNASLSCHNGDQPIGGADIDFSGGNDGSGTWSITLSDLHGATSLYFVVETSFNDLWTYKNAAVIPVPVDDKDDIELGTVTIDAIPLAADKWVDGEITRNAEDIYTIDVTSGTTYYLWWNDAWQGDGSTTAHIYVSAWDDNGNQIDSSWDRAWDDPVSFTTDTNGKVYIKVGCWDTGTYAIAYSTNSHWWNNSFAPVNVVSLDADSWVGGEIFTRNDEDWYSIDDVTAGQPYYLWWNHAWEGDDSKSAAIDVFAWDDNGDQINLWNNNAWNDPVEIYANLNGKIYLRVRAYDGWGDTGTYAIVYSTRKDFGNNSTIPNNPQSLAADTWVDGEISEINTVDWYEIDVTADQSYYLWWNHAWAGDNTKSAAIEVYAWDENGDQIWLPWDGAWNEPAQIYAYSSGKVYLRVRANNGNDYYNGSYGIMYSTNRFGLATPVQLTANEWEDGEISMSNTVDWYEIDVTAGQSYYLWWNDSDEGNGEKTLDVDVYAWYENGDQFGWWDSAWNDPVEIYAHSSGTVYLRVRAYSGRGDTGTYGIMYSTNRWGINFDDLNAVSLTPDVWEDDEILTSNDADWYEIDTTEGTTYYLWWNDSYEGNGDKIATIEVYAWDENGDQIGLPWDGAWDNPAQIYAYSSGKVYLRVRASNGDDNNTGTYGIVYSESDTRPEL